MTKRIATRRLAGAETATRQYEPAPAPAPAAPAAADPQACAVIEYEDRGGHKTYRMTKNEIVVGRGGRDYWTDLKLDTLPDVSREHFRLRRDPATGKFFLKDLSRLGTTIDGAEGALQHRVRGRREARPQRGGRGARQGAHRPGGRPLPRIPKRVEWLRPKLRCAGGSDEGPRPQQQRRRLPRWTPSAASSWWWTASAGRRPGRRPRKSRWPACAPAWNARRAPPSSASARPSPWPTTRFCAPRAATRNGRAWPAC